MKLNSLTITDALSSTFFFVHNFKLFHTTFLSKLHILNFPFVHFIFPKMRAVSSNYDIIDTVLPLASSTKQVTSSTKQVRL